MIGSDFEKGIVELTEADSVDALTRTRVELDMALQLRERFVEESIMTADTSSEIQDLCTTGSYIQRQMSLVEDIFLSKCRDLAT